MQKKIKILFFLGFLIPTFLVFKAIFTPGPAVWGDAPYFYPEGLKELFAEPFAWTARGHNFGGLNEFLWIYPLTFVYAALHNFLDFGNDIIIRILFYIPAILLSLIGPILFTRYLGYSKLVQFFSSLFYILNTYFILLIDGGQVGVALAYGIFPLALLFLYKSLVKPDFNNSLIALVVFISLLVADVRVAIICLLALTLWLTIDYFSTRNLHLIKNFKILVPLIFIALGLSAYWILPLVFDRISITGDISGLQLTSLLNSLLVFQPHWPNNEFGKVSAPPFYFIGLPSLLFLGLVFRKNKLINLEFLILFLFFGFLAKGNTPPLGQLYEWLVTHVPLGIAFRDPTKFFIPLTLFGGILIGNTLELIRSSYKKFAPPVIVAAYFYFLFLIHPAVIGNLNGVLRPRIFPDDFSIVYERVNSDNDFSRTAWFPNVHPFAFQTEDKQAINASELVKLRPLAALNAGNDIFNFMHQGAEFSDWFSLLGIKYLIFPENTRVVNPTPEENEDWNDLKQLVATNSALVRENWGTQFPVYSISNIKPHIFSVDKAFFVLGGNDIYQKLRDANPEFSVGKQGFFFFEDGKFNPAEAQLITSPNSEILIFNNTNETDLVMSFLQKYFISPKEAEFSEWAVRNSDDYLKWKYELLTNGIEIKELDYGQGIAFSSVIGEKIKFAIHVAKDGDYVFAVRKLSDNGRFKWSTEKIHIDKGELDREFININGLDVINTVALFPEKDWENAQRDADSLVKKMNVVRIDNTSDNKELAQIANSSQWHELEFKAISPTEYSVLLSQKNSWIIFTDSFSDGWHIRTDSYYHWSVPVYSVLNGFFVHDYDKEARVYYSGQEDLKIGEKLSAISLIALVFVLAGLYSVKKVKK